MDEFHKNRRQNQQDHTEPKSRSHVPAHLFAGVWGTLAVCIAAGGDPGVQIIGILAIGAFVFGTSYLAWFILDKSPLRARIPEAHEELGQDAAELGIESYPEFVLMPETGD